VFQGVHMLFQGTYTNEWAAEEKRGNKFVFIGRNLPVERLQAEFNKIYAGELRFPVGAMVLANVGKYVPARVVKHWDEGNPYRLKLELADDGGKKKRKRSRSSAPKNGDEVWGMIDEDDYVKAFAP
jgi:hypothetical protein